MGFEDGFERGGELGNLTNVSVASPSDGQVLSYQASTDSWIATTNGTGTWPTATNTDYAAVPYEQAATVASNSYIALTPNGTGGLQAQVADGTAAGGNSRGENAVDWQTTRVTNTEVASGDYAVVAGGQNNTASNGWTVVGGGDSNVAAGNNSTIAGGYLNDTTGGTLSFIGGGESNLSSGGRSVIAGGGANTASGDYSVVGGGFENVASGEEDTVAGGRQNQATGGESTVGGGDNNVASDLNATVGGGNRNEASANYATVPGGFYGLADHEGELAHASGRFAVRGDAQYSRMILRRETADATPAILTADGAGAPTTDEHLTLVDAEGYQFSIQVIARDTSGTDSAWWRIEGCITRDGGAGSTAIVGTNVTTFSSTTGAATWTVTATADTTAGALKVEATGAAATTIRWVAVIHSSKVGIF